jgi:hypothetical protein
MADIGRVRAGEQDTWRSGTMSDWGARCDYLGKKAIEAAVKDAVKEERQRCISEIEHLRTFGDEGNGLLRAVILLTDGLDNG